MVEGTANVKIDETVKLVTKGQSVYVPLGLAHLLMGPNKFKMVFLVLKTGGYLGEDDIVRYEDQYANH